MAQYTMNAPIALVSDDISSGKDFTVNDFSSGSKAYAVVYFSGFSNAVKITKFYPEISSVKVGGQNWLSTEIVKITYEPGYYNPSSSSFATLSEFSSSSDTVSEKDGTTSSSVTCSCSSFALLESKYYPAYRITVESTQSLVGCKVVMSGFALKLDYEYYMCTAVFQDWDKKELKRQSVYYGTAPTPPSNPTRAADDKYTYTFSKWEPSVVAITEDTVYEAKYTATPIPPPKITDVSIIYAGKQVSSSNKVIAGEGFVVAVNLS